MIECLKSIGKYILDNLLSVITIIIALIALFQTNRQIKLSNRQFLFDKRVKSFVLSSSLMDLYESCKSLLDYCEKEKNEPIFVDIQFITLTNIDFLKDISCIINEPKNNEYKTNFLSKMEELKQMSVEANFIFRKKHGKYLGQFLYEYQNVLTELYKYQIIFNEFINDKIPRKNKPTYNELQNNYGEPIHRERLCLAIDKLKVSYNNMIDKDILNDIEKSISIIGVRL